MAGAIVLEVPTQVYGADGSRDSCAVAYPEPTLPFRDVIALKVRAEVERAEWSREPKHALSTRYLTDESLAWARGGAMRPAPRPPLDAGREIERVLMAFRERRFVVDGSRCDDLDARIALTAETKIRFVRILPLRSG